MPATQRFQDTPFDASADRIAMAPDENGIV
jgi:hypothetical protein